MHINRWRHGGSRSERGAAAVEFALVVPVLLMLVFGMVDFARGYNTQITLNEAAAEGARMLAIDNGSSSSLTDANTALDAVLTGMSPAPARTITPCAAGKTAKVQLSVPFTVTTPLVSATTGTITITGVGVRQCAS